jgi:hypothetical protein
MDITEGYIEWNVFKTLRPAKLPSFKATSQMSYDLVLTEQLAKLKRGQLLFIAGKQLGGIERAFYIGNKTSANKAEYLFFLLAVQENRMESYGFYALAQQKAAHHLIQKHHNNDGHPRPRRAKYEELIDEKLILCTQVVQELANHPQIKNAVIIEWESDQPRTQLTWDRTGWHYSLAIEIVTDLKSCIAIGKAWPDNYRIPAEGLIKWENPLPLTQPAHSNLGGWIKTLQVELQHYLISDLHSYADRRVWMSQVRAF